ncbi:MAG TPA: quinoprotein dehydrogenase-associated SoxYZ-like carrier [Xanthobacteraceae bacterium]|nr:quinoprotein dehydrogenase-associated SoxYZ-like carrier [Xanthobacteraceae bacterium]
MVRHLLAAAFAAGLALAHPASAAEADDAWASLANDVFKGRPLVDGAGLVTLDMPARAEDAAIVPVTMRVTLPAGDTRELKTLTLVIDGNPAPVAAAFKIAEGAGISTISTRVRVDSYTNVHAVAELSDGQLYMVKTYVKASGGCAAPAAKNADEAVASLGQMKFRQFLRAGEAPASVPREAQIMIRHPNNSGLQRDQVTLLYIPPFFVNEMNVWQGDKLLFSMEGGISISEDPNFRFDFRPNGAGMFRVEARDTDGKVYRREWPAGATEM